MKNRVLHPNFINLGRSSPQKNIHTQYEANLGSGLREVEIVKKKFLMTMAMTTTTDTW